MYGDQSDCFIIGRKTYQTMLRNANKPYIILTKGKYQNHDNKIFANFNTLSGILRDNKLKKPLVLGGNQIYSEFIKRPFVLKTYIVIENNIKLKEGILLEV